MSWVTEMDFITKYVIDTFYEVVDIINNNPVVIPTGYGDRNTHLFRICVTKGYDRMNGSLFHHYVNGLDWLFKVSAQKHIEDHPAQANPACSSMAREKPDETKKNIPYGH